MKLTDAEAIAWIQSKLDGGPVTIQKWKGDKNQFVIVTGRNIRGSGHDLLAAVKSCIDTSKSS